MASLAIEHVVKAPSHTVECSGSNQYAYTLAEDSKTFSKATWTGNTENDSEEIKAINSTLPEKCIKLKNKFTAKFGNKLAEFYLGKDFIVGFEDEKIFSLPDSIFLQRVSPFTKTFDLVCFYGKEYKIFNVVDRKDLDTIRDWYPNKIFSCSADPLPFSFVNEFLKTAEGNIYEKLFDELFKVEESSASEYEESEESDDDYESDDVHESSGEEQEVSEYESSSDDEDDYKPDEDEEDDDEDDEDEDEEEKVQPIKKKRKMF